MATIEGNLWEFNMARLVVLDVTDDYRLMRLEQPLPNEFYPVLAEVWVPLYDINKRLTDHHLLEGYLYDWHQSPESGRGTWFVGVVDQTILA